MDPAAARAFLPPWLLPFSALLHAAVAAVLASAVGALLCVLGRRAIARRAPWPLRARSLFAYRWTLHAAFLVFAIPLAFTARLQGFVRGIPALSAMAAALLALAFWRWRLTRAVVGADHTLRRALASVLVRVVVLRPQLWTVLPLAIAMPLRVDATAALLAAAIAVALVRMPFVSRLAPPVPPEMARAVIDAAARRGLRVDGVVRVDLPEANAYALPFARRIAFSRAAFWKMDLVALLALGQLEALRLRAPRVRTVVAALLVVAPVLAAKALGFPMVAAAVVAIALANAPHLRPHPFDERLDREAAAAEPAPGAYARALAETHRLDLVPVVLRLATLQPDVHDRLVALGAPLPYPRPRMPSPALFLSLVVFVCVASVAAGAWGATAAPYAAPGSWTAATLSGADVWFAQPLGDRAYASHVGRRYDEAALLYGAAAALDPREPVWPAHQCMALAAAGRKEEARRALEEASRRGADSELVAAARKQIDRR
jgi:hypothetical protein